MLGVVSIIVYTSADFVIRYCIRNIPFRYFSFDKSRSGNDSNNDYGIGNSSSCSNSNSRQ